MHEIFWFKVVWPHEHIWAHLINVLKYFRFWLWIFQDILLFVHSMLSRYLYIQICFAYSQYTNRCIPHIFSISTDSFRKIGRCAHIVFEYLEENYFLYSFKKDTTSKNSMYVCNQIKTHKESSVILLWLDKKNSFCVFF